MLPTYDQLMLPILEVISNGEDWPRPGLRDALADRFSLTPEDLAQLLPSGSQTMFVNRIGWARTRLAKAGLVEGVSRGVLRITADGVKVLEDKPLALTEEYLRRFPSYREWIQISQKKSPDLSSETRAMLIAEESLTPEESLSAHHLKHRTSVEAELLVRVRALEPAGFERLVVQLLLAMGYGGALGGGDVLGRSGDGGIDGIIQEDKLGLDLVYVQAKRWQGTVGRPEIQGFVGSLVGRKAAKGVFLTTSSFSDEARKFVDFVEKRVVLVDGTQLASLMFEFGVGVSVRERFEVKVIDNDFFEDV